MSGPRHVSRRDGQDSRPRGGLQLGPLRITALRVFMLLAVVGSAGYLAYAFTVRDQTQIPMLASGAAVLGIVFGALALTGVVETVRAARGDRPGRSVVAAIFGGVAGIVACACFAAAAVLTLLWGGG
jgi:hypothetical protein